VRRHRLLLFLAAVFAAKLVVVLQLRGHPLLQADVPGFESAGYVTLASTGRFGVPPLYVYFLALLLKVVKGFAAVRIVQIVLGTIAVGGVFAAARVWFGARAAWIAALFAALTGLFTFYEATILPSALDPFLTAVALATLAAGLAPRGTRQTLWFGVSIVAFALCLLNRPALIYGGLRFYVGNSASADGTYRPVAGIAAEDLVQQRFDARRVAEASSGRKLDDGGVSSYFYALGRSWIRLHPGDAASLFGRKLALVFNAAHVAPTYSYRFFADDADTLLRFLFVGPWLLLPLGLAGLVAGAFLVRSREYAMWAAFVPLFAFAVAIFFVTERGRLPLLIPLSVGAGAVADYVMSRRSYGILAVLAAIAGLALLTNRPLPHDDGRAEDRTRMAEAMIVRDRVDLADQWTAKAIAIHPRPSEVHLRVGRRLVVHSRPEAAIAHLERVLRADPLSAEGNFAMGQALVQAKRPREAIPRLRAAMQAGMRESLAGYELTRAMAASGDRAGALQTLQSVRPEDPADVEMWNALGRLAVQLGSPSLAASFFNGESRARQLRQGSK
jgi:tetratricopeptide (TPR) repeat protein